MKRKEQDKGDTRAHHRTQVKPGYWEQSRAAQTSITVAARGVKQPHPKPARTRQQNDGNPEEPTEHTREKDPYQER